VKQKLTETEMKELINKSLKEDYLISYDEITKSKIISVFLNNLLENNRSKSLDDATELFDYAMKKIGFMKNSSTNLLKKRLNLNDSNIEKINKAQISLIKYCEENNFQFVSHLGSNFQAEKSIDCNGENRKFTIYVSFTKIDDGDVNVDFTMQDVTDRDVMGYLRFYGETPEAAVRSAEEEIAIYGIEKIIKKNYWKEKLGNFEEEENLKDNNKEAIKGPGM